MASAPLGKLLQTHMDRKGWGIRQLAGAIGVPDLMVMMWMEDATFRPPLSELKRAAEALGIPQAEVLQSNGRTTMYMKEKLGD